MKIGAFDLKKDILVVAEIGNNHEGRYALAERMIKRAAAAGAGAVKFQTIVPCKLVSANQPERIKQLERFRLSYREFEKLAGVASREKVIFLSTPFDVESAHFLEPIVPAFKIASGDNDFFPLIETTAKSGKPIILSTGLSDFARVKKTVEFIRNIWKKSGIRQQMAVLHCVTSYPAIPEQANLSAITTLREMLGLTVGYSDHTIGMNAAILSVALGARIIEKHFTMNKDQSGFRDHKISTDPEEFRLLVRSIKEASAMLGDGIKRIQPDEKIIAPLIRRSICAKRCLSKGMRITPADITWLRAGEGLSAGCEKKVIGRILRKGISAGEAIKTGDIRKT